MRAITAVVVTILFLSTALYAAAPTGTITGVVQDSTGSVVPGVRIVATSIDTGLTRATVSSANGGYVVPLLPVGTYKITIEAQGFEKYQQVGIVVTADQNSAVPITLKIGSVTQSVTVDSNAQMLETRSGALSQVINSQNINQLPLNGRNPAALILLTPGTTNAEAGNAGNSAQQAVQSTTYPNNAEVINSNGSRYDMVNYNLDGVSAEDIYNDISNPFPNPDAVEEFSVVTNSYSAEYGRGAGAIVNVVTKSGTNDFHGGAFDFLRNEDLNATNYFAKSPDQLKRNQFGGDLGGPIAKNKIFFFGAYQGTVSNDVTEGNPATLPTAAERNGNFSAIPNQLVNPATGAPYQNNQIPTSQFASASQQLLGNWLPVPTSASGLYYYALPVDYTENQYLGRADYDLSNHHIFGRYFATHYLQNPNTVTNDLLEAAGGYNFLDQTAAVSDTWTINPHLLNSAIFGYLRDNDLDLINSPFAWPDLGVAMAVPTTGHELSLSVAGFFSIQTNHFTDNNRHTFDFEDSLHWMVGSHEITFGGDFLRENVNMDNIHRQNGVFTFSTTTLTGSPLADFMLGDLYEFQDGGGEYYNRSGNMPSLFAQDNYRVSRSLVLNYGLRWAPFLGYPDTEGRTECFRPGEQSQRFPNAPEGYIYAGDSGCPAGGVPPTWRDLAPRLGFAYNHNGTSKTSIRGGWGLFYQQPFILAFDNMADSAPFSPQVNFYDVPFMNPFQGTTDPFPAEFGPQVPPSNFQFTLPLGSAVSFQPNWTQARIDNWNLTVEQQLATNLLLRMAYVGSVGRHLSYINDMNAPLPSPTATKANEQARRPYQQFVQVNEDRSGANSSYNALQVTLEKRLAHGFSLTGNYTWSKSLDIVSSTLDMNGTITVLDPYDPGRYRSVSSFNMPQNFVLNAFWQLPSPKSGVAKTVLGGWSTTGIWTWQDGFPLNITSGTDTSFSLPEGNNGGYDQASYTANNCYAYTSGSRPQRIHEWFNTSCYTVAPPNNFGNVGRNTLVGPGTFNVDFAAHKMFQIRERYSLEYRAELFNALNNVQLENPDTVVTAPTFGEITAAQSPRIIQMALKLSF